MGVTRQGFEIQQQVRQEVIAETDAYGESVIDWIYRGGDVFAQFISRSYAAGSISPFWPWGGGTFGIMSTTAVPIASLASGIAEALVMTALANTPAAINTAPATLTAPSSLLAPNFDGRLIFDSRLRDVPIRHQFLPVTGTGLIKWFTLT